MEYMEGWGSMKQRNKKVLILSLTEKDDYALAEWRKNGVDTDITLKDCSKIFRAIRRIWIRLHLPFEHIWYGDWKKIICQYDCVLVHGTWMAERVPHWIRKKLGKEKKIIWWYWNKITEADHPERVLDEDCEKWSFDREDCEKYGMRYNTQYYFKSYQITENIEQNVDVYFLGSDGGRLSFVINLKKKMESMGIICDFNILISDRHQIAEEKEDCFILEKMNYQENLNHIGASKAVLEILREGQTGQTLRALECLFHKKKLITNDLSLEKAPYYHSNNIFLLGKDEFELLPEFLERPYVEMEDAIVQQYESKMWLERFGIVVE